MRNLITPSALREAIDGLLEASEARRSQHSTGRESQSQSAIIATTYENTVTKLQEVRRILERDQAVLRLVPERRSHRELSTILAALRYWQREGMASSGHEHDVATDGGTVRPLSAREIDALCKRLNCG